MTGFRSGIRLIFFSVHFYFMTAPLQADVQVRTMQAAQANQALSSPVQTRRGEVQGITLTIPLLTERNAYLVVKLPDQAVRELVEKARALPENQRAAFIRGWVMRNQQAILEQHVRSPAGTKSFRYDVVPVAVQPVAKATPQRTEPPKPPAAAAVPSRREMPTERRIQPGPSATRSQLPPLPAQVKGGGGSRASPYVVYRSDADMRRLRAQSSSSAKDTIIEMPFRIDVEGLGSVYFTVRASASQLTKSARSATATELWRIFQASMQRIAAERGVRLDSTAVRDARRMFNQSFPRVMQNVEAQDKGLREYLGSH